ncbi:uncharacterized protein LOC111064048 isoform X2 [Nilaparvata lugens]|uniref:uncharacterized protein LOC120349781 isoform X2 n=1 Tax=Nilaparvata lugens TaxID=108931 RepID=UPI000B993257|nr:uncharacterized protein LOC120349781 isoform X2 [Nilaparvata lugens]XP_039282210.1 uncharacterized protein LOC120350932 isoform X2 [Nilaparvata lugens]XP_039291393.1 uncharacterized protein LOC111064048 isoform X2 [Nilaparvata lugens]
MKVLLFEVDTRLRNKCVAWCLFAQYALMNREISAMRRSTGFELGEYVEVRDIFISARSSILFHGLLQKYDALSDRMRLGFPTCGVHLFTMQFARTSPVSLPMGKNMVYLENVHVNTNIYFFPCCARGRGP